MARRLLNNVLTITSVQSGSPSCTALKNALCSGVSRGNRASVVGVSAEGLGGSRWNRASKHLTPWTSRHQLPPEEAKGKGCYWVRKPLINLTPNHQSSHNGVNFLCFAPWGNNTLFPVLESGRVDLKHECCNLQLIRTLSLVPRRTA